MIKYMFLVSVMVMRSMETLMISMVMVSEDFRQGFEIVFILGVRCFFLIVGLETY